MLIAGVDEVGRGPLAGTVVAAAVILDERNPIPGLTDSKKLSEKKREYFFEQIKERALCFAIAEASVEEIDRLNIFHASLLAMQRAVEKLSVTPSKVLVDGTHCPKLNCPSEAIIKGDLTVPAISAASILAKVTRDRQMIQLAKLYPQYDFPKHKGYPTKAHLAALQTHGISPIHRRSFAPVRKLVGLNKTI